MVTSVIAVVYGYVKTLESKKFKDDSVKSIKMADSLRNELVRMKKEQTEQYEVTKKAFLNAEMALEESKKERK